MIRRFVQPAFIAVSWMSKSHAAPVAATPRLPRQIRVDARDHRLRRALPPNRCVPRPGRSDPSPTRTLDRDNRPTRTGHHRSVRQERASSTSSASALLGPHSGHERATGIATPAGAARPRSGAHARGDRRGRRDRHDRRPGPAATAVTCGRPGEGAAPTARTGRPGGAGRGAVRAHRQGGRAAGTGRVTGRASRWRVRRRTRRGARSRPGPGRAGGRRGCRGRGLRRCRPGRTGRGGRGRRASGW